MRNIKMGIINLITWAPIIWADRWWDGDYLVRIIEFKLRHMADKFEKHGSTVGNECDVHNMRICAELCKRIQLDNYGYDKDFNLKTYFNCDYHRTWVYAKQRDSKYLGKLLGKYLPVWWD